MACKAYSKSHLGPHLGFALPSPTPFEQKGLRHRATQGLKNARQSRWRGSLAASKDIAQYPHFIAHALILCAFSRHAFTRLPRQLGLFPALPDASVPWHAVPFKLPSIHILGLLGCFLPDTVAGLSL